MIEDKDLRAAVQRGLITEAQAAGLLAMADARRQARDQVEPGEEPFVLFKGFNEIFIVIGLSILFLGWVLLATAFGAEVFMPAGADTVLLAAITILGLGVVQRYFTLRRRMIAPSIALAIMTASSAFVLGSALSDMMGLSPLARVAASWGMVGAVMLGHYRVFRVPFDAAIIAVAGFSVVWALLAGRGLVPGNGPGLLHMSRGGALGALSLVFGLLCFTLAMRFDMSDPHRVSTRSTTGFWLHVVAAPAIINTLALRLLDHGQMGQVLLLAVLLGLAVVAIVIDRRSFLVSGSGYAIWLIFGLFDGSALIILFLGLGLVLLGAQWDRLRSRVMNALPAFSGKDRLPPYGSTT
jgi:hypothetical protein